MLPPTNNTGQELSLLKLFILESKALPSIHKFPPTEIIFWRPSRFVSATFRTILSWLVILSILIKPFKLLILELSAIFKLPETNSFNRQLNNIGLIIFIDAGNAFYRDFQNESLAGTNILDHIAWSFGGSLTYNTPAGIIRFTPALQIYEPIYPNLNSISNRYFYKRFSDAWTFHISLGQAF